MQKRLPTIRHLRALITIAETGHFGRAAEILNITQPSLTAQLQEMERVLSGRLVERGRTTLGLTPLGEEVARRARGILRDLEDLTEMAHMANASLGGLIRLGVLPTFGPYFLPSVVPALHAAFPDLKLHIREDRPDRLETALREGRCDVLLTTLPATIGKTENMVILREPLRVGVPSDHRDAAKDIVDADVLHGAHLLSLGPGHRLYDQVRAIAEEHGANLLMDYEGSSLDALRQMVGMGMGLSIFPELYVRSEMLRETAVVAKPSAIPEMHRTVGVVWREGAARRDAFATFAQTCRNVVVERFPDLVG